MDSTNRVRADLHCHSSASEVSRLGVQRSLGLPECKTDPHEAYDLARRRGMDFVTLTDHDTIDGCLELMGLPGFFCSEELTTWFRGEPQAVHVLCWGIDPDDHAHLQEHARDVEACAAYLADRHIACALAHPFHDVAAPLEPRHRRRLAELFGLWEVRNGSRPRDLNQPAAMYAQAHGLAATAGSDDHAGTDIGRTWTSTPAAACVDSFLGHLRAGRTEVEGAEGGAAKWAHAALALAARSVPVGADAAPPDPARVMEIAGSVVAQGAAREGRESATLGPDDAASLLGAYLDGVGLDSDGALELMQAPGFRHEHLARRARREHERRLAGAARTFTTAARSGGDGMAAAFGAVFSACIPAVPYVAAEAFVSGERRRARGRGDEPRRVAVVADGMGSVHGVSRLLARMRDDGVPRYDIEVVGTDPGVDRRLPSVAELPMPFYEGLEVGVPALTTAAEVLAAGHFDLVHVATPGPAGITACLLARLMGLPVVASHHTELGAYTALRSGDAGLAAGVDAALGLFYKSTQVVLSPSAAADATLLKLGVEPGHIARWDRGVDLDRFTPRPAYGERDTVNVLYAGRVTEEKGVPLLADAFLAAHARDPRLRLVVAGGGPEEGALRERLGGLARFLGWLEPAELAAAYAGADLFCFPSQTDTFGQVVLEAQASGLPVVAARAGGPVDLILDGQTGVLCQPDAGSFAGALIRLAADPAQRERLGRNAAAAARGRTWPASFERLARGYDRVLVASAPEQALEQAAA